MSTRVPRCLFDTSKARTVLQSCRKYDLPCPGIDDMTDPLVLSQGMVDLIKKDSEKGIYDLI